MEKIEENKKGLINKIFSTKSKNKDTLSSKHLTNWEFIIDFEGNYLNISQEVQQCLGISAEEFNNQSIFTFSINPSSGENLFKKFSNQVFPMEENVVFVSIDNEQVLCNLKLTTFIEEYNQKPTYIGLVQVLNNATQNEKFEKTSQLRSTHEEEEVVEDLKVSNGHKPQISTVPENLDQGQQVMEDHQFSDNLPVTNYSELLNNFSIEANHIIDPIDLYKLSFKVLNKIFPDDNILLAVVNKENTKIEIPFLKQNNEILYYQEDEKFFNITSNIIQSKVEVTDPLNLQSNPQAEEISFTNAPTSFIGNPIICGKRILGATLVFSDISKVFEIEKLETLRKLNTFIGYALENVYFFHEMQNALDAIETREKYQNQIVLAIKNIAINGLENLTDAFELLGKATNIQRIFFAQPEVSNQNKKWKITHQWFSENKFDVSHLPQQLPMDYIEGFSSKLIESGYIKIDFEKLESPFFNWLEIRETISILLMKINLGEDNFCLLGFEDLYHQHIWKNEEITYLKTISEILSQKIINENNYFNLNKKLFETEKFTEIINKLSNFNYDPFITRDVSLLVDNIQKLLEDTLEANTVIIHFRDAENSTNLRDEIEVLSSLIDEVIEGNRPKTFINTQSDRSLISASISISQIITPIRNKNLMSGVVIFIYNEVVNFDDQRIQNHQLLTDQISLLIENFHLRKKNEELKQIVAETDSTKNKFISNISHEFRTPLNSIIGFSKVILNGIDGPINETQKQDLTTIYTSGQTILRMVNEILDISKIESGNFELDKTRTEIKPFLNSLLSEVEAIVKEKVIDFDLYIEENLPEIHCDRIRIKQVILHLISNATKNTEIGKISLSVSYKLNNHNNPEIIFTFADSGQGIELSDQKDLFKPFTQLSHHEKNRSAGSGLGLALSKAIIELHGGKIGLSKSILGEGSEFFFTLPIK